MGCGSNIATNFKNININSRRGGSSDITTSCSSDIAADDSIIISGSLSGRGSRRRKEDLVRDPVVTLNSNGGDRELPTTDVTGALAGATEALMVSGIFFRDQKFNYHHHQLKTFLQIFLPQKPSYRISFKCTKLIPDKIQRFICHSQCQEQQKKPCMLQW